MKSFLIDFENVKSKGLTGIESLNEEDHVIIFYSENSDTISFEMHYMVMQAKAKIDYMKVRVGGKNALDFQLCSLMGYLVAKGNNTHIFVISNDKGFDKLHDFWKNTFPDITYCSVYRCTNIESAMNYANRTNPDEDISAYIHENIYDDEYEASANSSRIFEFNFNGSDNFVVKKSFSDANIHSHTPKKQRDFRDSTDSFQGKKYFVSNTEDKFVTSAAVVTDEHDNDNYVLKKASPYEEKLLKAFTPDGFSEIDVLCLAFKGARNPFELKKILSEDFGIILEKGIFETIEKNFDFIKKQLDILNSYLDESESNIESKLDRAIEMQLKLDKIKPIDIGLTNKADKKAEKKQPDKKAKQDDKRANTDKEYMAFRKRISDILKSKATPAEIKTVFGSMEKSDNDLDLCLDLIDKLGWARGSEIHTIIKPEFMTYIGESNAEGKPKKVDNAMKKRLHSTLDKKITPDEFSGTVSMINYSVNENDLIDNLTTRFGPERAEVIFNLVRYDFNAFVRGELNQEDNSDSFRKVDVAAKKRLHTILDKKIGQDEFSGVIVQMNSSLTTEQLHQNLVRRFGQSLASQIYRLVKDEFIKLYSDDADKGKASDEKQIKDELADIPADENVFLKSNKSPASIEGENLMKALLKDLEYTDYEFELIRFDLLNSKTPKEFYLAMVKKFKKSRGLKFYNALKNEYKNLNSLFSAEIKEPQ
ncbi:MAG: PIN domain-containing protein [Ruminococcus sp.]|nr:PIN domain-containing protein [Ruminococcus sp.]